MRLKSSQDELIRFARAKPGRLACSTMQRWDQLSARTGEEMTYKKESLPPCARRFFLNVVRPSVQQDRASRNIREIEVLAHVMDLLATNKISQATDVLTQRMVACRIAEEDKNWTNAHFVELIPLDSINMVPKSMRILAKREGESEKKMENLPSSGNDWKEQEPWQKGKKGKPWWKGKDGKGKKDGKDGKPWWKGDKGKGKGKKW